MQSNKDASTLKREFKKKNDQTWILKLRPFMLILRY
jgi:hypothetical protein